jgi:SAM-dependent methyltransferase
MAKFETWNKDVMFNKEKGSNHPPLYPNEYLVKCFSSESYSFIRRDLDQMQDRTSANSIKVLEVGSFAGNNLKYFLDRGFDAYGCEVSKEIGDVGVENLRQAGYDNLVTKVGDNCALPFEDDYFDVLVSINTIHYSFGTEIGNALLEWKRVLKKGGILFLETVGPEHFVRALSEQVAPLHWIWGYNDFRKGQSFGFFDSETHLDLELKKVFGQVETGRRKELFPRQTLDFLIGIAKK